MSETQPSTTGRRRRLRYVLALVAVTLAVRGGVAWWRLAQLDADPDGYRLIAANLVQRHTFSRTPLTGGAAKPTAYRPPIYPIALAMTCRSKTVDSACVAILHVAIGIATVVLTWFVCLRWGLGYRRALVAALAIACDPILLNQSTVLMTETAATLLAVVGLLVLPATKSDRSSRSMLVAGMCLGVASLCRPTFFVWGLLVALGLVWRGRRWRGVVSAMAFVIGVALVCAPWAWRNWRAMGQPVVATTHGGYTLLLGNNPFFYRYLQTQPWGEVWDARPMQAWQSQQFQRAGLGRGGTAPETAQDQLSYWLAWRTIRRAPATFVVASAVRVGRLWTPLPHAVRQPESMAHRSVRYLIAMWYILVFAMALTSGVNLLRVHRTDSWLWGALLLLSFTVVHSIYWSNMRMRAPLMPFVYIVASTCCASARLSRDED